MTSPLFPQTASTSAVAVNHLLFGLCLLSAAVLLLVFGPMIYFLWKYRRNRIVDRTPVHLPTLKIEITWTLIPLFISMGLFVWGADIYYNLSVIPSNALELNVVGKQWMWKIQHPEGKREIDELHVPAGRPVKLILASQDVIHSFYLPAFRIKQDAVPGRFTAEWFKAARPGTYHLFCAEYCGTSHSKMIGRVVVMTPADYETWLHTGSGQEPLALSGARLFRELGCSGCHSGAHPAVRAPPLEGLYGRPVPLQNGGIVIADEKYLRDSILLPQQQIAAGYPPLMPSFRGHVSEEQLFELIAYIKSIGNQSPPEVPPNP